MEDVLQPDCVNVHNLDLYSSQIFDQLSIDMAERLIFLESRNETAFILFLLDNSQNREVRQINTVQCFRPLLHYAVRI